MVGLYPGALYPGLYDWLLEVPVGPELPPGTCLTSDVGSRCEVTAEVCSEVLVTDGGVSVTLPDIHQPPPLIVVVYDGIDVRYAVEYVGLECRRLVTSSGVKTSHLEDEVPEPSSEVIADVKVTYLVQSAIECRMAEVTSSVEVSMKVTADLAFCCHGSKS